MWDNGYAPTEAHPRVVGITQQHHKLTKWSGPKPGVLLTIVVSSSRYAKVSSSYC